MIALFYFVVAVLASPFKPKSRLEAENAVLRHQLNVVRRKGSNLDHYRSSLRNLDRLATTVLLNAPCRPGAEGEGEMKCGSL